MLVWFLVLAILGLRQIVLNVGVLLAFNPLYAVRFFVDNRLHGFLILGVVFLVVTGGEALYADMGHFGKRPIRLAWFVVVMPALLLNYFGQGALLLADPREAINPFYHLAPSWALYPMVILATTATVVASQAVISGAFSLTMQAVQLGYLPRMEIRHTSEREYGQIYVPAVNVLLLLCTVGLVLGFGNSSRLAAAYGVAVTTTMVITTLLAYHVMRGRWKWPWLAAFPVIGSLLIVDLGFFLANMAKILAGGWFPLLVGLSIATVMTTWNRGRQLLSRRLEAISTTYEDFFAQLDADPPLRVPGTAIHLCGDPTRVPRTVLENLHHNRVLHQRVAIVSVVFDRVPFVRSEKRIEYDVLREDVFRITIHYGFKQSPHVPRALAQQDLEQFQLDLETAVYILGRETLLARRRPGMSLWRERLFAFLARNALGATAFFRVPTKQVLELGAQIAI
jgi:KUP system potassium uptake protein